MQLIALDPCQRLLGTFWGCHA